MDFPQGFNNIFELADHVATFLNEEDARYMAHDIAICIMAANQAKRGLAWTGDFDPAGHDIAALTDMVRDQETDSEGNWLHVA